MDRLSRSRTQKVLGFVLRSRLVMFFRDVIFFCHETEFEKNPAGMDFFGVELKLRKCCVLDLKMRQKVTLFDTFSGRVRTFLTDWHRGKGSLGPKVIVLEALFGAEGASGTFFLRVINAGAQIRQENTLTPTTSRPVRPETKNNKPKRKSKLHPCLAL